MFSSPEEIEPQEVDTILECHTCRRTTWTEWQWKDLEPRPPLTVPLGFTCTSSTKGDPTRNISGEKDWFLRTYKTIVWLSSSIRLSLESGNVKNSLSCPSNPTKVSVLKDLFYLISVNTRTTPLYSSTGS